MKKAQMRVLESVAVLIVFFILMVIGSSVYFGMQNSKLKKDRVVFEDSEALRALVKLQSLPELDCSFASAHTINCFDLFKLQAFSNLTKSESAQEFYYPLFGDAVISVKVVFPLERNFTLYDVHPVEFKSLVRKTMPVLVYDPVLSRYYFGLSELIKYA
ncbi:hypothetical protein DRJ25_00030 [Candidatus Woesearchaeota archaeon]|nr:MAG: hypothetical protein DRJ25_00030 [Candidatus Woesearchaeota archaeon]